jgi:hypothetical protein
MLDFGERVPKVYGSICHRNGAMWRNLPIVDISSGIDGLCARQHASRNVKGITFATFGATACARNPGPQP